MIVEKEVFGKTSEGIEVNLYTLINVNGMCARIINYGAILVSLEVPSRNGDCTDITLGYDNLEQYIADNSTYFGATVGRYAGHIVGGRFTLDGIEYTLAKNDGSNHLHGGNRGFNKVIWNAQEIKSPDRIGVKLSYLSKDGEEGYPGNLNVTVKYTLTDKNELQISYKAETDKPTPVNLTHHSYFNLAGHNCGDILSHELMINADYFNPAGPDLAPTGEIKSVKDTPMDFTQPAVIGSRIGDVPGGYDHNYALNDTSTSLTLAAIVREPITGQKMEVYTNEPALQFYTGNFLDGKIKGKEGTVYKKHAALCLEAQQFPDAPNKPQFPTAIIKPGQKYIQKTVYKIVT